MLAGGAAAGFPPPVQHPFPFGPTTPAPLGRAGEWDNLLFSG